MITRTRRVAANFHTNEIKAMVKSMRVATNLWGAPLLDVYRSTCTPLLGLLTYTRTAIRVPIFGDVREDLYVPCSSVWPRG